MRSVYVAAVVPILVLFGLALFAGYTLGDLRQIPMQWGLGGKPNWYAPKWIGLMILPIFGIFPMINLIVMKREAGYERTIRNIFIVGAILILSYLFVMYMLGIFS